MQVRRFGGQNSDIASALVSARPPTDEGTQQLLESNGVSFPPGAYVHHLGISRGIIVRNTPRNLALIQAMLDAQSTPRSAVITTHIFQAPGPLLRQLTSHAARKTDHRAELNQLLAAVKAGDAMSLATARLEALSGIFSTLKQGVEHSALTDASLHNDAPSEIITESRNVGLRIDLTPTIGADGSSIELTLSSEYHTAPPLEHREHLIDTQGRRLEFPLTDYFTAKTTTGITIPSGSARLLSLYKPTGKPEFEKEDILQAIFITCDILRASE